MYANRKMLILICIFIVGELANTVTAVSNNPINYRIINNLSIRCVRSRIVNKYKLFYYN